MNHLYRSRGVIVLFILAVFLGSLYGCSGQQAQPEQAPVKVSKLDKKYTRILVYPFTTTDQIQKDYPDAASEMMSSMMTALQMKGEFKSVNVAKKGQRTDGNTLILKADITSMRIVSKAARFWGGAFAGSSGVELNLKMIDGGTGKVVREKPLSSSNNAWGAAYTYGSSDSSLPNDMGKIIAGYVEASTL